MLDDAAARLERFCQKRAGDSLRAILVYEADTLRMEYARDDMGVQLQSQEIIDRVGKLAWENHKRRRELLSVIQSAGDLEAVVLSMDTAFIIQFPVAAKGGILVSFEPEAGRFLGQFIHECRDEISSALGKD